MKSINLNTRKYELISQLIKVEKEKNISIIEDFFAKLFYNSTNQEKHNNDYFKPILKSISVEEMEKQQDYKGFNRENFNDFVAELNIQEPVDELLSMLTK